MAEVPFCPVRQLSEYKGKGASASSELSGFPLGIIFVLVKAGEN